MRRGKDMSNVRPSDRPWNDPGPRSSGVDAQAENEKLPALHALVLDFSTVSNIDTTSVQALIDARTEIEKWADRPVEFHFATILSPWISRALIAGGFGIGVPSSQLPPEVAAVVPYRDGRTRSESVDPIPMIRDDDFEAGGDVKKLKTDTVSSKANSSSEVSEYQPVVTQLTPFFHLDLTAAVRAAESGLNDRRI